MKFINTIASVLLLATSAFSVQAAPVDINQASAYELATSLTGVGSAKALAIIEYRVNHGFFKSIQDLALVKGIGQKTIEKNKEDLLLGELVEQ